MKKLSFLIPLVLFLIIGLAGCTSKMEQSAELVNRYYNSVKGSNFDECYDLLSSESKSIWTKEKYTEWESIEQETFLLKDVKIEKINEFKNKELWGTKYEEVVEYSITNYDYDYYHDKDTSLTFVIYAVNEKNQWKIYRGKEDPQEKISKSKWDLAAMYFRGKGKNKDINKAEEILNESIKENPNYGNNYFLLGGIYNSLQKYDDAIDIVQKNIDKVKSDEEKSNLYYVLGWAYELKNDYTKAKEYYTKSMEANPTNKDAESRLEKLK